MYGNILLDTILANLVKVKTHSCPAT